MVCAPHFQWEQSTLLNAPPHPECLGFHNGRVALFSTLEGAFLRQGVPLFPPKLQGSIDGWDCPIHDPRETWQCSGQGGVGWVSRLLKPVTSPSKTDFQLWNAGFQDTFCCSREVMARDISGRFRFQRIMLFPYLEVKPFHVSSPRVPLFSL